MAEIDKELDDITSERAKLESRETELTKRKDAWKVILGDDLPRKRRIVRPKVANTMKRSASDGSLPFWEIVNQAVSNFNEDFSTPEIETWLNDNKLMPDIKQPRARIKMALGQLEKKGYIVKTFAPVSGAKPHKYRIVESKVLESVKSEG